MGPGLKRGRTTQKRALSVSVRSAVAVMSTRTSTCCMSSDRFTLLTVPRSTALCLTLVCPAAMPSPV